MPLGCRGIALLFFATDALMIAAAAGQPGVYLIAWLVAPMALMAVGANLHSNLTFVCPQGGGNES